MLFGQLRLGFEKGDLQLSPDSWGSLSKVWALVRIEISLGLRCWRCGASNILAKAPNVFFFLDTHSTGALHFFSHWLKSQENENKARRKKGQPTSSFHQWFSFRLFRGGQKRWLHVGASFYAGSFLIVVVLGQGRNFVSYSSQTESKIPWMRLLFVIWALAMWDSARCG